jgi:hypothetical protein
MRGAWSHGNTSFDWVEFFDPEDQFKTYRVNMTFMMSPWGCLFGEGCPGLLNRGVDYERGCCERGVTFMSEDDFNNVANSVTQLTAEDWDYHGQGYDDTWYLSRKGKPYITKKKDGRCIFSNRAERGKSGKSGCAFYSLAQRTGQNTVDLMPEIAWGVPIMHDEEYDATREITTITITANDADDWGGEDERDASVQEGETPHMGWWCMDTPDAFRPENPPFYIGYEKALRRLFGDSFYEGLLKEIALRGWDKQRPVTRMPGEVVNEGRPLLPLLIKQAESRE